MITLVTNKTQITQRPLAAPRAAASTMQLRQNNTLPAYPRGLTFGMALKPTPFFTKDSFMEEGKYKQFNEPLEFPAGSNVKAPEADVKTTMSLTSECGIFEANSISADREIKMKNATVNEGIFTWDNLTISGDLSAKSLNVGKDISIGKVNNLNEIHFIGESKDRVLTVNSNMLETTNSERTIKVYLDDTSKLKILNATTSKNDDIQNKFTFLSERDKKTPIDNGNITVKTIEEDEDDKEDAELLDSPETPEHVVQDNINRCFESPM